MCLLGPLKLSTTPENSEVLPSVVRGQRFTHLLISKISHTCQEICDIKRRRKPKSNSQTITVTTMEEGDTTSPMGTLELSSNNSAKEGSNDEGGLDDTYSSCSTQYHCEPSNLDTPSHHAPVLPSLNPMPSESTLEPPGDLSPSPASRTVTLIPSSPGKLERKACSAALSSLVHTSPSGPCTAWKILLSTQNGLGEESTEESVMEEELLLVTGERGGGLGVGGCQGHSTLSSQRVFEGAWLTQLVQLVTAGRLFPCHKGQVDLSNR